ncbi:hypothetical protein CXB51_006275 [Gossypium anomalum]|uniref:MBD domain-containing protein n=1 Tax=Gossypium anomalum TaxID=47600 RepID=A0A8J6D8S7_9ROSI|nr:hypothetical protein CXB51_006275 [Gossypium anomalum]
MDDQKDIKDIKVLPAPIPEGWVLDTKFKEDGTEVKCYLCPATEQQFYTYEDLMRYVRYAKAAKVSIYSPYFEANMKKEGYKKLKKEGQS